MRTRIPSSTITTATHTHRGARTHARTRACTYSNALQIDRVRPRIAAANDDDVMRSDCAALARSKIKHTHTQTHRHPKTLSATIEKHIISMALAVGCRACRRRLLERSIDRSIACIVYLHVSSRLVSSHSHAFGSVFFLMSFALRVLCMPPELRKARSAAALQATFRSVCVSAVSIVCA